MNEEAIVNEHEGKAASPRSKGESHFFLLSVEHLAQRIAMALPVHNSFAPLFYLIGETAGNEGVVASRVVALAGCSFRHGSGGPAHRMPGIRLDMAAVALGTAVVAHVLYTGKDVEVGRRIGQTWIFGGDRRGFR